MENYGSVDLLKEIKLCKEKDNVILKLKNNNFTKRLLIINNKSFTINERIIIIE